MNASRKNTVNREMKDVKSSGISGSPRKDGPSGSDKLVRTVLEAAALDYDLVSSRGKTIEGCMACLGCADDNV